MDESCSMHLFFFVLEGSEEEEEAQRPCTPDFGVESQVAYCSTCRMKVDTIVDSQIGTAKLLCFATLCLAGYASPS